MVSGKMLADVSMKVYFISIATVFVSDFQEYWFLHRRFWGSLS